MQSSETIQTTSDGSTTRSRVCCYFINRIWCSSWNSSRINCCGFRTLYNTDTQNWISPIYQNAKNEKIKTQAESNLDSISDLVSKAIEDANVSHEEYQFILKEKEHYRKMKEEICAKSKKAADKITAEQREEILKQGQ